MLNKQTIGNTMKTNKYQIDTVWFNDDTEENITFELHAQSEDDAWTQGEDYMQNTYSQELYNVNTTITKVGA